MSDPRREPEPFIFRTSSNDDDGNLKEIAANIAEGVKMKYPMMVLTFRTDRMDMVMTRANNDDLSELFHMASAVVREIKNHTPLTPIIDICRQVAQLCESQGQGSSDSPCP